MKLLVQALSIGLLAASPAMASDLSCSLSVNGEYAVGKSEVAIAEYVCVGVRSDVGVEALLYMSLGAEQTLVAKNAGVGSATAIYTEYSFKMEPLERECRCSD